MTKTQSGAAARTTIAVQGARVHNLKNISVEIPRDALIVVTGLSGSGKSSLAFDTIYAEGQRRYMESLSSYAKRFVAQVAKPDVDFVFGLSPVISIEQKTLSNNPRSTVGTMTDVASYLNLLFATIGQAHCPRTGEPAPSRTASQILEAILSLPEGTEVELRAPVFPIYGEDVEYCHELRRRACAGHRGWRDDRSSRPGQLRPWMTRARNQRPAATGRCRLGRWTPSSTASSWGGSTRRRSRPASRRRCSSATG
jgi:excinuclease ABC subunit A